MKKEFGNRRQVWWVLLHLSVWLLIFASVGGILVSYLPIEFVIWKNLLAFASIIGLFYLTSQVLVPHLFEKGDYFKLVLYSLALLMGVVLLRYQLEEIWLRGNFEHLETARTRVLDELSWIRYALSSLVAYVMGFFYRLIFKEVIRQNRQNKLLALQYETELKQLLHQINPHFLFNTLNNIYTLAVVRDERAAPMLLKLSNMLRTTLYQSEQEFIPLKKEVELLNNVLDIYSLSFDPLPLAKISVDRNPLVPPLLFLPIIENMFKHGDASRLNLWVLDLHLDEKELHFYAKNPISKENTHSEEGSGIGLQNVQKRLELLFGERGGAHFFEKKEEGECFIVNIKLPLS